MPWYSWRLVRPPASLRDDVRVMRRGFRWGSPRPRGWPPAEEAVADRPSNLGWARMEPVRTIRYLLQQGVLMPFTDVMTHPKVEGREWVEELDRPAIIAPNHQSHADIPLLLYSLSERTRDRTVVAAAADYWYKRPWAGRLVSLWLNTFPFSRTGGAQGVLSSANELLKSGWNLVLFPEGTRSPDGRLQEFKPGVGFLATETGAPVVPVHVRGAHRVMPKGQRLPLPAPVTIRIGRPLQVGRGETSRAFTKRVEDAVRDLGAGSEEPALVGSWIERWRATAPKRGRR